MPSRKPLRIGFVFLLLAAASARAWQVLDSEGKAVQLKKDTLLCVESSRVTTLVDPPGKVSLRLRLVVPESRFCLRWIGPPELLAGSGALQVVRKGNDIWHLRVNGKAVGLAKREGGVYATSGGVQLGVSTRGGQLAATMQSIATRGVPSREKSPPPPDLTQAYVGWALPASGSREALAWKHFREGDDLDAVRAALRAVQDRPDNLASAEVLFRISTDRSARELIDSASGGNPVLRGKLAIAMIQSGVRRTWPQWLIGWKRWGDAYSVARYACEEQVSIGAMGDEEKTFLVKSQLGRVVAHPEACASPAGPLYANGTNDSTRYEKEMAQARAALAEGDSAGMSRLVGWSARYPQSGRALVVDALLRLRSNVPGALAFAQTSLERVLDDELASEVEVKRNGSHEDFLLWLGERHSWAEDL